MIFNLFGQKSADRYVSFAGSTNENGDGRSNPNDVSLKPFLSKDSVLAANIRRFVDNVMISTPIISKVDGEDVAESTIKSYNQQLKDIRFYKLMRAALYGLVWNGNAFFEVKFNGKKIKEMYVIDPDTMKIRADDHGDIIGYTQELNGQKVNFEPDEIVHISIDHLNTDVWGKSFLEPLRFALQRKAQAEDYLAGVILKLAPIVAVKSQGGSMTKEQWSQIVAEIKTSKNPSKDLMRVLKLDSEDEVQVLDILKTENFNTLFQYIDKQNEEIITLLQTPPIVAGTVDNSNRSNSEIQARLVFYNSIMAFQNVISEELNYELLKKLNWKNVEFKFPAVDKRDATETLKLAKTLMELGYTQEAVHDYIISQGVQVKQDFNELPVEGKEMQKEMDEYESREPRDKAGLVKNEEQRIEDKQMGVSSDKN